jgi:hypothetical protein
VAEASVATLRPAPLHYERVAVITKHELRMRLLDALGDFQGGLWQGRPVYAEYVKGRAFRTNVAGPTHTMFGARCYVCGVSAREAERTRNSLTTAHIIYPPAPWDEVIDPDNLTRSDVVLLCWSDHQVFDMVTELRPCVDIEELRRFSVDTLDRMRVGRRTGEDLPPDGD